MKLRMKTLTRAILATSLVAGLGFSQTALAEEATGTLAINAGLSEAMTVTCGTALNFGITRVQLSDYSGDNTIVVAATGGATKGGTGTGVTVGDGAAGECSVSGSSETTGTITVSFTTSEGNITLSKDSNSADLKVGTFTTTDGDALQLSGGGTTFNIGGTLTIPDNLTLENMGDYTGEVVVTVTDSST